MHILIFTFLDGKQEEFPHCTAASNPQIPSALNSHVNAILICCHRTQMSEL
jgi:hypothetical protein